MTARREASAPPTLPGYAHVRTLGLGGFADVFLYRQDLPRREVAVKVLLAGSLDDEVRARFQTEANLMAQLSHHPSIVTVYQAAIASDGRPYLVMEYCSRPGLAERYRSERIAVPEVLRIGVRLASAVETAHRAGILHRDIKPANVLTTDFGWPALTDFGIAATTGQGAGATVGMSIPWSPPELLAEHPHGDERSDVYSLAATLYSLLAGRTPFEIPGGQNGAQQLVARIERAPLPPTGRDDVPADLQAVLERAMAKVPELRHPSAAALGRALQQIEADLRLPVTPLDLLDEGVVEPAAPQSDSGAADATRLRSIVEISSAPPAAATDDAQTRVRGPVTVQHDAQHDLRHDPQPVGPGFLAPPPAPPQPVPLGEVEHDETPARGRTVAALVSGAVVLAALAVVAAAALGGGDPEPRPGDTDFAPTDGTAVEAVVPAPHSLEGVRDASGAVTFSWVNPDPKPDDHYLWGVLKVTGQPELEVVDEPTVTIPAARAGDEVCVEVSIVRADRRASAKPAQACA
ncbi:serine/threonine-protein kinase [Cellulomonas uda]|uniref:non-specific serine/threonine protein kinase n=1 Tax=Cellulomonas uda TaxID=1714 RepID=A0A4Y3KAW3_CELUD|nr:serine/threonine-protein kinase [Cellulomonas uda]NII65457.1 serine/threonine protein kinase [Cellulomonas uda]GEA81153.1 serine/threonine protein kinase [Cellulomonas uda]